MSVVDRIDRIDLWFFPAGTLRRYRAVRTGLAVVIALRLSLGSYPRVGGLPDPLFHPRGIVALLFDSMPPRGVLVAAQVIGAGLAWLAVARVRPRLTFPLAWATLLVLAGLKGSLGKILHNDVLVLVASLPFVLGPRERPADRVDPGRPTRRWGWAPHAALVIVALLYCATGLQKLRHSGIEWVTGDNTRWVMVQGAASGRAPTTGIALFVAERAWLAHVVAASFLLLELTFPIVLVVRRARPFYALGAAALHVGTWLTLGLDYWGWVLVVAIVLMAGDGRWRSGRGPVGTSRRTARGAGHGDRPAILGALRA